MGTKLISVFITAALLIQSLHCLKPQVLEVDSYKKLRSLKSSSLYEVIPHGDDSTYEYNPYLLYAEGSRYGKCSRRLTMHANASLIQ